MSTRSTAAPHPAAQPGAAQLAPTPAQTIGPFYGYALPFPGGGDVAPAGDPATITIRGRVLDGTGDPVPDALLEFWQAGPDGTRPTATGSMRRDPVTGTFLGRTGADFTGFGRVATDADGAYTLRTLAPGGAAPYLSVCVFARGLLNHLFTRVYLPENAAAHVTDPVLSVLAPHRRATLVAIAERDRVYRFDLRLQGNDDEETVFLDFG